MNQTVVVGLDGASWELVTPWLADGELPNLARIRNEGSWATQRSCLPPVTLPNWKCYSTSKNPGNLGVFWFEHIDLDNGEIRVASGGDFATAELWDYLNDAGIRTGVVNMPTMYPPRELDGVVVCGGPDAVDGEYRSINSGYTSPDSTEEWLKENYDYSVHPQPLLSSNEERGEEVDAILELLDLRFQVAVDLLESQDLDFVHVTLFYLNVFQHFFWQDEPTRRAWQLIDGWLGRLIEMDDINLVVMSDHGSTATEVEFYINEWFAENGYLKKTRSMDNIFQNVGLTRENALSIAKQLGIVDLLAETVPTWIQKRVPQAAGAKRERKLELIELSETKALASGQGPVYVNPAFDEDSVVEELIEALETVTDASGTPLFDGVYRGHEVYDGEYMHVAPSIVIDQRDGVTINDGLGGSEIQTTPRRWAAENAREGIFAAIGPDFEPQGELGTTDIRDLAPTILAANDISIPRDMEGEVLPVVSSEPTYRDPIQFDAQTTETDEEVASRLKQLGYME